MPTIVYSGGFDPLHKHHLQRMLWASKLGDLVVAVESDEFVEKKHPVLLSKEQRCYIISCLDGVKGVYGMREDFTVSHLLRKLKPEFFLIGPDHIPDQIDEYQTCNELGIGILTAHRLQEDALSSTGLLESYFDRTLKRKCIGLKAQYNFPEQTAQKYVNPPVTVSAIILTGDEYIIGIREDGKWDLPGGFVEPGESLEEACWRECREEVGPVQSGHAMTYFCSDPCSYSDGRKILTVHFYVRVSRRWKVAKSDEHVVLETRNIRDDPPPLATAFSSSDYQAIMLYKSKVLQ